MKAIVRPGEIDGIDLSMAYESEDIRIVYINSSSKRYDVLIGSCSEGTATVTLYADDNTLHVNESLRGKATEITFPDMDEWRFVSIDQSKYETHITYIREAARKYSPLETVMIDEKKEG